MIYSIIFSLFFLLQESDEQKLIGDWDLKHYDAIQKVKASPRYVMSDAKAKSLMDKQLDDMLKNGGYSFTKDTLDYADLEGTQIKYRVGLWKMKGQILYITELGRPFSRRAFIHHLSADSLVLSPIVEEVVSDTKMIFRKNREDSCSAITRIFKQCQIELNSSNVG
jgi:hypothetical protein